MLIELRFLISSWTALTSAGTDRNKWSRSVHLRNLLQNTEVFFVPNFNSILSTPSYKITYRLSTATDVTDYLCHGVFLPWSTSSKELSIYWQQPMTGKHSLITLFFILSLAIHNLRSVLDWYVRKLITNFSFSNCSWIPLRDSLRRLLCRSGHSNNSFWVGMKSRISYDRLIRSLEAIIFSDLWLIDSARTGDSSPCSFSFASPYFWWVSSSIRAVTTPVEVFLSMVSDYLYVILLYVASHLLHCFEFWYPNKMGNHNLILSAFGE